MVPSFPEEGVRNVIPVPVDPFCIFSLPVALMNVLPSYDNGLPLPVTEDTVNVFVSSAAHAVCAIVSITARVRMRLNFCLNFLIFFLIVYV
jgi:hypothetical protein